MITFSEMGRLDKWRPLLLQFALIAWVTGFWWCRGRWEQGLLLQWVVLPAFALNADHAWNLWKEWFGAGVRRYFCWWSLFSLIEWQFWVTGARAGDWWGGAGSGKDFVVLSILVTSLALLGQNPSARLRLWWSVMVVGLIAIGASFFQFYQDYGISEQRFRLVWRYRAGFNAVTTGILVGFALVVCWGPWARHRRIPVWGQYLALIFLGAALAASESRGALLAALVAGGGHLLQGILLGKSPFKLRLAPAYVWQNLLVPVAGFVAYWAMALQFGKAEGDDLMSRGSAGRLDVYQEYLKQLSGWDWAVGTGEVFSLPPEELGWLVHHPHSAYLGQLAGYGVLGSLLLLVFLGVALWAIRRRPELPLVLFGLAAGLFDGGQFFSAFSVARWEILVVFVPLVVALSAHESLRPSLSSEIEDFQ
ncbi:hypothetical protein AAFN60_05170 [Roseibacillus persicicus]|uniref:hypothetical protein n=1 Tax=Roseibacillus persicicus TaxID=454148 RepID=UPI00398B3693